MTICDFLKSNSAIASGAIILPNLGGWAGAFITKKNIKPWYETLNAPTCKPPNYVFGPVWTSLYCGMGYASYLVYKQGGGFSGAAKFPLALYAAQLAMNWAWTPIFFHFHELKWVKILISLIIISFTFNFSPSSCLFLQSFVELFGLTACAAATGVSFYSIDKVAGLIFVPYLAWLSFASYLNFMFYKLNTPAIEEGDKTK